MMKLHTSHIFYFVQEFTTSYECNFHVRLFTKSVWNELFTTVSQ